MTTQFNLAGPSIEIWIELQTRFRNLPSHSSREAIQVALHMINKSLLVVAAITCVMDSDRVSEWVGPAISVD